MYIVVYAFRVKPNQERTFIESWRALTKLIYKNEGSLGSRLHKKETLQYIAYAQWPSEIVFEESGGNLPDEANQYRDVMRASCEEIKVLEKLEVVEDLLEQNPNGK
ncbi:antibiotic biosynthesis monooxygenase [Seonamhaeicola sp. MEBiC1930]|uniref:antibiotic biosynthesis monooxygenase family protein n=1 Tax=Seonamhaeicola sp. MEBiC01930 TaxID=2976768 RepID=UPI003255FEFE